MGEQTTLTGTPVKRRKPAFLRSSPGPVGLAIVLGYRTIGFALLVALVGVGVTALPSYAWDAEPGSKDTGDHEQFTEWVADALGLPDFVREQGTLKAQSEWSDEATDDDDGPEDALSEPTDGERPIFRDGHEEFNPRYDTTYVAPDGNVLGCTYALEDISASNNADIRDWALFGDYEGLPEDVKTCVEHQIEHRGQGRPDVISEENENLIRKGNADHLWWVTGALPGDKEELIAKIVGQGTAPKNFAQFLQNARSHFSNIPNDEDARKDGFEQLGRALHYIQDMGLPYHTISPLHPTQKHHTPYERQVNQWVQNSQVFDAQGAVEDGVEGFAGSTSGGIGGLFGGPKTFLKEFAQDTKPVLDQMHDVTVLEEEPGKPPDSADEGEIFVSYDWRLAEGADGLADADGVGIDVTVGYDVKPGVDLSESQVLFKRDGEVKLTVELEGVPGSPKHRVQKTVTHSGKLPSGLYNVEVTAGGGTAAFGQEPRVTTLKVTRDVVAPDLDGKTDLGDITATQVEEVGAHTAAAIDYALEAAPADVALIIDSSGSMSWNDPEGKRKEAARSYLSAVPEGDSVAVVDFDDEVDLEGLKQPSKIQNFEALKGAIEDIDASGGTDIRAGIERACQEFKQSGQSPNGGAILLTDGHQTSGSFGRHNYCFAEGDGQWPVYTFGFGDFDETLLEDIAAETGGQFAAPDSVDELVCKFNQVRSRIAGDDPGSCTSERVGPGRSVTRDVDIEGGTARATFSSSWGGSDVEMTLTSPSGRVIDRDTDAADVTHDKGATFEVYGITNPEAGTWDVELFGAEVPDEGEDVVFGMSSVATTPPSANASAPTSGLVGEQLALDASGSSDPDGTIASYAWDLDGDGAYDDATGASAEVTFDTVDTFSVGLQVTDDAGATSSDTVEILVANAAPEVGAAGDVTVDEGATATNTGTFSDPGPDDVTVTASVGTITQHSDTDGNWDWTFDAVEGPGDSQTVTITAQDAHGAETSTTFDVTVNNVAPKITELAGDDTVEGLVGEPASVDGEFTDPGVEDEHTLTVDWGDGASDTVTLDTGERSFNLTHHYRDDNPSGTASDDYAVSVTVADDDGGSDTDEATVTVDNLAPDLDEPSGDDIAEAETATVSAQFTDAGLDDSHEATVHWGDGTSERVEVEPGVGVPEQRVGVIEASHVYGDDGEYTVTVTVVDDDTGEATATTTVSVANLDPSVELDTAGAVAFPGEEAFLGRKGVEQSHAAEGDDAGSDDLTFAWRFDWRSGSAESASTTYFNDTGDPSGSPDPDLSPQGTFPFTASDTATFTPSRAGVADVTVELADDDGGADADGLVKLVAGDRTCTRSQGFWKHQTSDQGQQHVEETTLVRYLAVTNVASSVFSELTAAATIDEADDVLWTQGPSMRDKAEAQLLAAWLNVSGGAVGWTEDVDGRAVGERLAEAEAILRDSEATHQELEQAKDLAEAVNLHDQDNPDCDGGGQDDQGGGPPPKSSGNGNGKGNGQE